MCVFCFEISGDHRDLHVLTHSFPNRRSSDLIRIVRSGSLFHGHAVDVNRAEIASGAFDSADIEGGEYRARDQLADRSEEHTSELQSLMRISYAVFCLKNKSSIQR